MPCHLAWQRELLKKAEAAVFRCYPFTIILNRPANGDPDVRAWFKAQGDDYEGRTNATLRIYADAHDSYNQ